MIPANAWNYGWIITQRAESEYFAKRGIICFSFEYGKKFSKPWQVAQCVSDVKSAMREGNMFLQMI